MLSRLAHTGLKCLLPERTLPLRPRVEAEQPEDWDTEEDGEWEAPQVPNPKCASAPGCGEWTRPMKPNPEYKGKWSAPMIDNPAYKVRATDAPFRWASGVRCDVAAAG